MTPFHKLLILLALILWPADALAERAAYTEGRLWIVDDHQLFSLAEHEKGSRPETFGEAVLSICVLDGDLVALTAPSDNPQAWSLHRRGNGAWIKQANISGAKSGLIALVCADHGVVLLTQRHIVTIKNGAVGQVVMQGELTTGRPTVLGTSEFLYIGYDMGEWGGGLQAISRADGRIHSIGKNATGDLCDGPLNAECDPVMGIVILPWKPECLGLAVGLLHLSAHGRIVIACDDGIETHYARQFGERFPNQSIPEAEAYETIPFFKLAVVENNLVTLGMDGIYRIGADGNATIIPLPKFKQIGQFKVSFEVPGVVLIAGERGPDDSYYAYEMEMVAR